MAYPCLILPCALNATAGLELAGGLNEDGEEVTQAFEELRCNFQLKATQKLNANKEIITYQGRAYFPDNPFGDIEITGGTITVNGSVYDVGYAQRAYNLDGTVNYTEIGVI